MASEFPDAEVYTLDDLRQLLESAAQDLDHQAFVCRRAREVTESLHQRERLYGKERGYSDSARILRMVVPRDEG